MSRRGETEVRMYHQVKSTYGRIFAALAMIAFLVGLAASDAGAQQKRIVIVNGQLLTQLQLAMLDRLAGGKVSNGSYWIDPKKGTWGYSGNPRPRGRFVSASAKTKVPDQTVDLYIGPFGTYKRDGHCFLISGSTTGDCG